MMRKSFRYSGILVLMVCAFILGSCSLSYKLKQSDESGFRSYLTVSLLCGAADGILIALLVSVVISLTRFHTYFIGNKNKEFRSKDAFPSYVIFFFLFVALLCLQLFMPAKLRGPYRTPQELLGFISQNMYYSLFFLVSSVLTSIFLYRVNLKEVEQIKIRSGDKESLDRKATRDRKVASYRDTKALNNKNELAKHEKAMTRFKEWHLKHRKMLALVFRIGNSVIFGLLLILTYNQFSFRIWFTDLLMLFYLALIVINLFYYFKARKFLNVIFWIVLAISALNLLEGGTARTGTYIDGTPSISVDIASAMLFWPLRKCVSLFTVFFMFYQLLVTEEHWD